MLYSFFLTQWYKPSKGDWTVQVQKDLEMFGIKCDFEFIRSKSKEAFKNLVKLKAKELALKKLTAKKDTHSKMTNLNYAEIAMQK